jgi:adenine-specific DNA-methyltransferase
MTLEPLCLLDHIRESFNSNSSRTDRSRIGQFLTPGAISRFMSSMFDKGMREVRILDPGAGAGVLFATCLEGLVLQKIRPNSIEVVAYETDTKILPYLEQTMSRCDALCKVNGVVFQGIVRFEDFVLSAIAETEESLFSVPGKRFTHVILNPPYKKINVRTTLSRRLYSAGIEVANFYAVFVWLSMRLLEPGGQMVAITPRSFCNGPYFEKFRVAFLKMMSLKRIHVFTSRNKAFGDDNVLQENVIYHAIREIEKPQTAIISTSESIDFDNTRILSIPYHHVVHPDDRDAFIHLSVDDANLDVMKRMECFESSLARLKLNISTGRTVDFRAREYLRQNPEQGTMPLIYPCHFKDGFINWPSESGKKSNAIVSLPETSDLLVEAGYYVLVKRFSSKEQERRLMAAIYDPSRIEAPLVSFENHLNYFHRQGKGFPADLAKGLALYLNSSIVDLCFRLFSGHTQVNATDLRKMPYPTLEQLITFGAFVGEEMPDQETIDAIVEKECEKSG